MATIFPDGWKELSVTGAAAREIETLALLEKTLSDDYRIYHGVHWTKAQHHYQLWGEIDFAIVSPAGKLLLVEQKSGFLTETPEGLVKTYDNKTKPVAMQMNRTLDAIRNKLNAYCKPHKVVVESLLYCPDYLVKDPGTAGIDPNRIVDARLKDKLPEIIRTILPAEPATPDMVARIDAFLSDTLNLSPDANAFVGQAKALYTRLSGGLAEWARKVECEPFRLRVIGTAGSGKTQLALSVFRDALAAGKRPLYVCFNRPLADHFERISPTGGMVATYHQLCDRICRAAGKAPDFSKPEAFAELEAFMNSFEPDEAWSFDELIIDEGQDFNAEWKDNLLRLLKPEGRAWWMEDPMQKLYRKPDVDLPGWVTLRSQTNYRSPRDIIEGLANLLSLPVPVEAGSPLSGSEIEILTYADTAGLLEQTKRAITQGIAQGFKRDMIAAISFSGREKSKLSSFDKLGPFTLKTFTGKYDLAGTPCYTEGDILFDSVYRFKGQAAPCIVFTEIDFDEMDQIAMNKIFVGATRASMKLFLVISEKAVQQLINKSA